VKSDSLVDLLLEFYREKLALIDRHQEGARFIRQYDFNNTYQYIIAREETHLAWVGAAIADLGGTVPATVESSSKAPEGKDKQQAIIEDDARTAQAFVDRWRPSVEAVTNARHQGILRIILGETLEHKRFFEQALAGRVDLLGRHADGAGRRGAVISTRWIE
jgi:hypothetical protein